MQNGASSVAEKLSALSSSKRELFNRRRAALAAKARSAPASYAQQRLWFIDQLSPGNPAYNVPYAARLTGTLRIEALAWSFGEMVRRHEVLRTTFVSREGAPVQMIHPPAPFPVPVVDLRGLTGAARDTAAARLAAEEAARPFDLAAGPLLRVRLLRLGADDHVLLVTLHHIVSDGWSVAIVVRELTALYDACCHGLPSPLPDMPLQYADFAVWQREWMQGPVRDRQLTWWRDQLAALPTLDLTTDLPRPAAPTHRGDRVAIEIDDELARALRALSRDEGVTLFMTLLAAFQLVLARHTGQDDIVVGTDVANRNQEQIEPLIGFFVNQLVLRTDLGGQPTIRELLHRVRDVTLSAYAHQDLPFEQLVEELAPQDRSRSPLFQVKFLLQHAEDAAPRLADVALTPLADTRRSANFDLTLALVDSETALSGLVEYATDLFTREHVERLAGHVQSALRQFVADADLSVDTVQVLREDERAQAVVDWNPRPTPRPDACVHHLFEAQVERTPDAMAVESGETRWTFAELNARANRIAHYLRRLGVGPETHVAVFLDRGVQWMAGVLGILKAGAAYVPLDVAYPAARLDAMLADAAAPIVVTDSTWRDRLPAVWASIVSLDTDAELIARESADNPPPLARPHHAAYVIYTSGTTGRPKGVVIEHRSVANLVAAQRDAFQVRPGSVVLQFASPGFDAAVSEWAVTLASGGCLVFASRDALMPGPDLVRTLRDRRVEIVTLPPSALRVLPDADLPSLRVLVAAGEACSTDIVRRWAGRVRSTPTVRRKRRSARPSPRSTSMIRACRRSARRWPMRRPMFSMPPAIRSARLWWATSSSAARAWGAGIWDSRA
jgi:non-ribosomal peptide synthetase component F